MPRAARVRAASLLGLPVIERPLTVVLVHADLQFARPASLINAIQQAVTRAARTLRGMTGLKVKEQKAKIVDGQISEYRVSMAITFVLDE